MDIFGPHTSKRMGRLAMSGLHLRYQLSPLFFVQKTKTETKQNKQTNKQPGPAILDGNDGLCCRLQQNFSCALAVSSRNSMMLVKKINA